jgi:protein SCO1/2
VRNYRALISLGPGIRSMNRRQFLQVSGTGAAAGLAGCLGGIGSIGAGGGDTYLSEPDTDVDPADLPYPAHGQQLPEVTLTDPLSGESVTTTQFDRDVFLTFFYSHCKTVCPVLIGTLRNLQTRAGKDGHGSAAVFLPVTFDPARDDASRLREYSDRMNVNLDAGNWQYLRPDSPQRAKAVVKDTYGVHFQKTHPEDMDMYMFTHAALVILANADGYVERAYRGARPPEDEIYEDFTTLRKRES